MSLHRFKNVALLRWHRLPEMRTTRTLWTDNESLTWQEPPCEEVEDGKGGRPKGHEAGPVHSMLGVRLHVHVDPRQPLAQSVHLHHSLKLLSH